jgi:hypothetical protein
VNQLLYPIYQLGIDLFCFIHSTFISSIGQTISINKFEETHEGLYECRVRRKDERSQSKTLKLIRRPPVVWRLPPGFDLCSGENRDGYCLNDGVCMQHIDSGKPTCRYVVRIYDDFMV